jgi:hypothetical protein
LDCLAGDVSGWQGNESSPESRGKKGMAPTRITSQSRESAAPGKAFEATLKALVESGLQGRPDQPVGTLAVVLRPGADSPALTGRRNRTLVLGAQYR